MLGNSFEPGNWRVTLDGNPVDCFRVNHAFLGVNLPEAGTHTLHFEYWPRYLTQALLIALGGVIFALAMLFTGLQRRPESQGDPAKQEVPPAVGT